MRFTRKFHDRKNDALFRESANCKKYNYRINGAPMTRAYRMNNLSRRNQMAKIHTLHFPSFHLQFEQFNLMFLAKGGNNVSLYNLFIAWIITRNTFRAHSADKHVQTSSLTICDYVPNCLNDGPLNYSRNARTYTHTRTRAHIRADDIMTRIHRIDAPFAVQSPEKRAFTWWTRWVIARTYSS